MKNLLKSILALMLLSNLFSSCTDEQNLLISQPAASFKILSPSTGDGIVLNPATPTATGLVLVWEKMSYEAQQLVTYTVQIDKSGNNFASPLDLTNTPNTFSTITMENLNGKATLAGLPPFSQGGIELRIKSTVGAGAQPMYSSKITYLVTPYTTALPKLGVPGNHQGWTPSNAATLPLVASSAFGSLVDYEGYMSLNGEFKFLTPKPDGTFDWGPTDYGIGSTPGSLGSVANCTAVAAGYYLTKANIAPSGAGSKTYSTTLITTWGIIGDATANGWGSSTPMTYNATTKKWTITMPLIGGKECKFRANNDWGINLGKFDTTKTGVDYGGSAMSYGGGNIAIATSGTYTITLDLSNPRAYTYTIL